VIEKMFQIYGLPELMKVEDFLIYLLPNDNFISKEIMKGSFEPEVKRFIENTLEPGDVFIDIGANLGYYTLIASRMIGANGCVFAFEPEPTAFHLLNMNITINELYNITAENKAVSDKEDEIELWISSINFGGSKIIGSPPNIMTKIKVESVSLDNYFKDFTKSIKLIKIDVEGAENLVIRGSRKILSKNRDIQVIMELWPYNEQEVYGIMGDLGFSSHILIDKKDFKEVIFFR